MHDRTDGTSAFVLRTRYDLDRDPDGPGTMQDFAGETTLGTWTLSVEDVGPDSTSDSSLASWTLHLDVTGGFDCVGQPCTEPPPSYSVSGVTVDVDPAGTDLDFNWNAVVPALLLRRLPWKSSGKSVPPTYFVRRTENYDRSSRR